MEKILLHLTEERANFSKITTAEDIVFNFTYFKWCSSLRITNFMILLERRAMKSSTVTAGRALTSSAQ